LARISLRKNGATSYIYNSSASEGTYAYIIDTSIRTTHQDFGGCATFGASFINSKQEGDSNSYSTHIAGTTGRTSYSVAKKTNLIAVKVLSAERSSSNASVLASINYAVKDAQSKSCISKAVANLSLSRLFLPITNAAVTKAVKQGLFIAIAASNSGLPTITLSPASAPDVCTVSASNKNNTKASYSNFGLLVDVFAPGTNITSTWKNSNTDTNTISGTSIATPHITGLSAYLLALEGSRDPKALCQRIQELSTKNTLSGTLLTKNYLAYNGNGR
jgi:subtilisin family serine protease